MSIGSGNNKYLSLSEIHQELVNMLVRAGEYFKANGVRYSLSDGTLLGAVRHKGFIPWDDDVDIYIPRPDYEQLLSSAEDFHRETGFELQNNRNKLYHFPFTKIVNPAIRAQEECTDGLHKGFLWIDVFPIDGVPKSKEVYKKIVSFRKRKLRLIVLVATKGSKKKIKALVKGLVRLLFSRIVDPCKVSDQIEVRAMDVSFSEAELVACTCYGFAFAGKSIPKDEFLKMIELPFEGVMQPCMSCYDEYLTKLYGNYMQLPSEEQRLTHKIKAWRVGD